MSMPPLSSPAAFHLTLPQASAMPVVFDSPHSSRAFPEGFATVASEEALLTTWDAYVDELWTAVPEQGGTLLAAAFPRAYIDANRSIRDIDAALLAEPWPEPLQPESYTARGMGLIRRFALPGVPMYDVLLPLAEVRARIDHYYLPYRAALEAALDGAWQQFGHVWHVDCHSMKSRGNAMNEDNGALRPDVVVSDRSGTSADPAFTAWVADTLRALGFSVQINDPYRGGDLVRSYGNPAAHRHSIQIELNRALYMDEATCEKHDGFAALRGQLTRFVEALRGYVNERIKGQTP